MATLNGDQAIQWMRAKVANVPGDCLHTVWMAYGSHPSIGPYAGQYPNAIDGWNHAARKHPGDANPPAGYPVYFDKLARPRYAGDTTYPCGDVVLSLGGGMCIATDGAGAGRIAVMSIAARARQIGRTYLGWAEDFCGYDVVTSSTASLGSAPIAPSASTAPTPREQDDSMKNIRVDGGTIAIVGELFGRKYTSTGGGEGFSLGVNAKVYPTVSGLSEDEVTTMVNEANARRAQLITEVAAAVAKVLPAGGGAGYTPAQIAAAVDAVLANDFAAIPDAVANEEAQRLQS